MKKSLIIGSLVAIALAVYGIAELQYQNNISTMIQAVTQTKKDILEPSQGVEVNPPKILHGDSLLGGWFCIDVTCPQIWSEWKILITGGQYETIKSQIAERIKQADKNNKWRVNVFSKDVEPADYPYPPHEGKVWTGIIIFVDQ